MARRLVIVTFALLLGSVSLGATAGNADDRPAPAPAPAPAPRSDGSGLKSGSPEAFAVQLEGAKVLSADGNVIGAVERVVERPGGPPQAVLGVGGFLGIGERRVLVPAAALSPSGNGVVRLDLTEAEIGNLLPHRE